MAKVKGYMEGNVGKVGERKPILMIDPIGLISPRCPINPTERISLQNAFFAFSGAFAQQYTSLIG